MAELLATGRAPRTRIAGFQAQASQPSPVQPSPARCATEQRLQAVLEEHAREKLDWQQQHHDWQQRQQDWQQQQLDWQQRQQDWQQQQQLLEKQLHDLLQRADLHAHIIAVSAANELAQLKEQLNVAQASLAHQALGVEQLQQSVVKLTTAVCTADARAVAAEAASVAAAAVAADASSAAHASAALLEQEQQLNAALLEETELLHRHVAIADAATMAAVADAEDKGVRLRACMADSKELQKECSNLMKRVARRDQALQELRAAQTAQTATAQEQEQPPAATSNCPAATSNCQHPSSRPHQTVQLCHTQVAAHATAAYKTSYLLRALQLLVACQLSFNKVQHAITSSLGLHLMPGQELIDRVPSGKTLKRAMDKIVETVNNLQAPTVEPRMVLREAYSMGCNMVWGPGDSQGAVGEPVTAEQVDELVLELVGVLGEYYTKRMHFLGDFPYLAAALGDPSPAARQRGASRVLQYLSATGPGLAMENDPLQLLKLQADLQELEATGIITEPLEQLLSRYFRPVHITNAASETALKPLNNDMVLSMKEEGVSGRIKMTVEDTNSWFSDHLSDDALGAAASHAGALGGAASHAGALGAAASPAAARGAAASPAAALGAAASPTGALGAAASPQGAAGTKPVQAAKQTSQARKVLRAMQRITLPVKLPTREEYSSAASARDQNNARQQRLADITNKLQHLEDTARQVYSCQQPHLPSLPQKGITLSHLKQLCVRLNLATKGAKSRIQCLEAISQHLQQQHQQAPAVATITPSKRHAPDNVMRMR
ncbi:hypothetical protein QJQ45_005510 [Haematococcus lacustris]|nr:hypothetical protein QJQ45_005510 [Haematococcus lacustris]